MVSAISAISSSVVTNGGQICSVLSWMVRISTPASVQASATASPEHVLAELDARHERGPGANLGHEVVRAQRLDHLLQHGLEVGGALDEVLLLDDVEVGLGDHAGGGVSGVGQAVPEHRRVPAGGACEEPVGDPWRNQHPAQRVRSRR